MEHNSALTPELKVTDFKRSLDFYTKIAQFEIDYDRPENQFAMLSKNRSRIMIEALSESSRTFKVGTLEYPFGRGMHFQFEVPDIKQLYENFRAHNYPLFIDLEDKWYRVQKGQFGNRQFLVQDPDGYLFRFYQDLGTRAAQ